MRLHRVLVVSAAVLMLASAASSQGNKSPEARLRTAMDKETVDGDLKAAIDGYKQVVSQRGASREVVAQALLRLGMAYEKQGDAEARKPYERLVREYRDQTVVVQQARARMAAADASTASTVSTPMLRRLCSGSECGLDGRSVIRDERLLIAYADNRLTVGDLVGGKRRQIAEPPSGRQICCVRISPDGGRLAYTVRSLPAGSNGTSSEIVVANTDGSDARTVFRGGTPEAWSSDGRRILAIANGQSTRLMWVTVADGATQPIPTSIWENMDIFHVSPDGRYIAFSGNHESSSSENVYVIAADGSGETRISASPNYQEPIGWSPDGRYLVYMQNGEQVSLWAVLIANGRARGPAVKIDTQLGNRAVTFLGLTPSGSLLFRSLSSAADMYTASMDPTTGRVTSVPVAIPTTAEGGGPAAWSRDSRRIAYLAADGQDKRQLRVFSVNDGTDRRVPTTFSPVNGICWPPSDDSILTNTITAPGIQSSAGLRATRFDAVRVDLATGDSRSLFPTAPTFRLATCTDTAAVSSEPIAVKVRNLGTGTETELYRFKRPTANYGLSKISPDGRLVAFLESVDTETSTLMTVPSTGGPARERVRAKAPVELQVINGFSWSYDGRFVYFLKRAHSRAPYELFRVPVAEGPEESMGLQGPELRGLEIAPDGRKLFVVFGAFQRPDIWAMDHFLPTGK